MTGRARRQQRKRARHRAGHCKSKAAFIGWFKKQLARRLKHMDRLRMRGYIPRKRVSLSDVISRAIRSNADAQVDLIIERAIRGA